MINYNLFCICVQDKAYQEQLKICGEDLPPLNYDEVNIKIYVQHVVHDYMRVIYLGCWALFSGSLSERNTEAPSSHHDHDEDGQVNTG